MDGSPVEPVVGPVDAAAPVVVADVDGGGADDPDEQAEARSARKPTRTATRDRRRRTQDPEGRRVGVERAAMGVFYQVPRFWRSPRGPVQWASSPNSRRIAMKIVVDYDECASNAVCMGIAPEVFEVRDDGFLYVLNEHPGPEFAEAVRQAANGCPTGAITLVEDE